MTERPVYLDNHATTAPDPRVLAAMRPWWENDFANPSSVEHSAGRAAAAAVERARRSVAELLNVDPSEIIFTSGATEANNLAIKGAARYAARSGDRRRRLLAPETEHRCVLEAIRDLGEEGFEPHFLPVGRDGMLDPDRLRKALLEAPTLLVAVMAVNNEIGIVQDVRELAALAREAGAMFHTDAAQAAGRIPLDLRADGVELASLSAHKIYGPKGVGALYVRRRPRTRLQPLFSGGGQERGLRSGTLPTPLIVGFGEAARLAGQEWEQDAERIAALRGRLLAQLLAQIPGVKANGDDRRRVAGNLSLCFPQVVSAQAMLARLEGLCVSTGSACSSAEIEPSYVLQAMGLSPEQARSTLRIGIGRFTSPADIDRAAAMLIDAWRGASAETDIAAE